MKSSNIKKEIKVAYGIWTPDAKVLCYDCHGDTFSHCNYNQETGEFEDKVLDNKEFARMNTPVAIKNGNADTVCNKCNKPIQLCESVAFENDLANLLKLEDITAYMAQTGGMNSAVEIPTKDNGFIWITYDTCGDKEWLVGVYDEEGDYSDESYVTHSLQDLLDYMCNLKDSLIPLSQQE